MSSSATPHENTPHLRVVLAAVAGALLYNLAVVSLGGMLAAVGIPPSYFAFFGRERAELALVLLGVVSWALPVLAIVALGSFALLRVFRSTWRSCSLALGLGMLACFLYRHASLAVSMASEPNSTLSFGQAFASTLLPAWWTAPNVFAPWAGLALAIWIPLRRHRETRPTAARRPSHRVRLTQVKAQFVHGMGRSRLSGWPLLWQLRRAGVGSITFGHLVSTQSFSSVTDRLASRIAALAARDDYILIGHSLGGVLLRAALQRLPPAARPPRHVFLLGSPVTASRMAQRFQRNAAYRWFTGDCGQVLASSTRMSLVGQVSSPTTSFVGVRGLTGNSSPFGTDLNDGLVSVSEASASWIDEQVQVPCIHTLLPASSRVADAILERLAR